MEHFVQFAISVDDNAIKERIESNVERAVIGNITRDIKDAISKGYYYQDKNEPLRNMVKERVDVLITNEKETILNMAAEILADRLFRSKKGKELLERFEVQEDD